MNLTPEEVKDVTDRRLAASHADGCIIHVSGGEDLNLRFARNSATSNGAVSSVGSPSRRKSVSNPVRPR